MLVAVAAISGCGQVNTVKDSPHSGSASPAANQAANNLPTISGLPATQVMAGTAYSFTPAARDDDGDALLFSIDNKPAWATFSVSSGRLSGTPTSADVGSYNGIVIRVTDGKASASLAGFTLSVAAGVAGGNGTAALSWTVPTQNTDGTPLTDLAGFWVYHGTDAANLQRLQQIANPGSTQYRVTDLAPGMHYFAVSAYNASQTESALSAVGSKRIP